MTPVEGALVHTGRGIHTVESVPPVETGQGTIQVRDGGPLTPLNDGGVQSRRLRTLPLSQDGGAPIQGWGDRVSP